MGIIEVLKTWGHDLAGIIWPKTCAVCGRTLVDGEEMLCLHCLSSIPRTHFHRSDFNTIHQRLAGGAEIERAGAFMMYQRQGEFSSLIRRGKYNQRPDLLRCLTRLYVSELQPDNFFDGIDVILAIPMHRFKRLKRGYNQSEVIAEEISRATGIALGDNLHARRGHSSQTRRSAFERYLNVKELFVVDHAEELAGCHILLVDDVITTGSTLLACSEAISDAVPTTRISILTLASASR